MLGAVLIRWFGNYVAEKNLGVVTCADGFKELYSDTVRGPDVGFVAWERLPDGLLPTSPLPSLVPNFVVEILSEGNTYGEMSRKRREYFHAGVELMWMVEHCGLNSLQARFLGTAARRQGSDPSRKGSSRTRPLAAAH